MRNGKLKMRNRYLTFINFTYQIVPEKISLEIYFGVANEDLRTFDKIYRKTLISMEAAEYFLIV